jgi:hypothetical protein
MEHFSRNFESSGLTYSLTLREEGGKYLVGISGGTLPFALVGWQVYHPQSGLLESPVGSGVPEAEFNQVCLDVVSLLREYFGKSTQR